VRAIGMHWILVWLVGMSDWLRGPPHAVAQWNSDAGMPIVFLAFAPVLALSVAALQWTRSVAARIAAHARQPGGLRVVDGPPAPYRDAATELRAAPPPAPPSFAPVLAGAVGLGATWAALSTALPAGPVLVGTAAALGFASLRSARAVAPSVLALCAVGGLLVTRAQHLDTLVIVNRAMLWPVATLAGLALYLSLMEGHLRLARAARPAR
jgi:hypothetical protein